MYKNITKIALRGDEEAATANYRFQTVWWTPAVIEQVWETLASYAAWPTWWHGIQSVEVLQRGDQSGAAQRAQFAGDDQQLEGLMQQPVKGRDAVIDQTDLQRQVRQRLLIKAAHGGRRLGDEHRAAASQQRRAQALQGGLDRTEIRCRRSSGQVTHPTQ